MTEKLGKKQFTEAIEKKVRNTIRKYKLLKKTDRIGIGVSGGKDSMSCLHILHKLGYNVEAVTIDVTIGEYTDINLKNVKGFCKKLGVKLHEVSFKTEFGKKLETIKTTLAKKGINHSYCMICGILKRYLVNKYAKKLEFDAMVTGHNLDDESQAFVMNVFRNDFKLGARQGPSPGLIKSGRFIKRVKPLYFLPEADIKKYSELMKFPVNYEHCPHSGKSFRGKFKKMLNDFEKVNPSLKFNIVRFQEQMKENLKPREISNIKSCDICGEPSSRKICKACEIAQNLE